MDMPPGADQPLTHIREPVSFLAFRHRRHRAELGPGLLHICGGGGDDAVAGKKRLSKSVVRMAGSRWLVHAATTTCNGVYCRQRRAGAAAAYRAKAVTDGLLGEFHSRSISAKSVRRS